MSQLYSSTKFTREAYSPNSSHAGSEASPEKLGIVNASPNTSTGKAMAFKDDSKRDPLGDITSRNGKVQDGSNVKINKDARYAALKQSTLATDTPVCHCVLPASAEYTDTLQYPAVCRKQQPYSSYAQHSCLARIFEEARSKRGRLSILRNAHRPKTDDRQAFGEEGG